MIYDANVLSIGGKFAFGEKIGTMDMCERLVDRTCLLQNLNELFVPGMSELNVP
jgi:hypothetical protein